MRHVRGAQIAMILQDPMASLNPLFSIYRQVAEPAYYHRAIRGGSLRRRVGELLRAVRIPSPEMRMREFPHQMSGGMRQRIVGAIALAGGPRLIIAAEPTHNLDVVARMCDKLAVMYAGKIVEGGTVRELFNAPQHPYTKALLGAMPKLGSKEKLFAIPVQPPDLATLPPGCAFHPRCPVALERCASDEPGEIQIRGSWSARCWLAAPRISDSTKEVH